MSMLRNLPILSIKRIIGLNALPCCYSKATSKLTPDEASKVLTFINRSDNADLLREVDLSNARIAKIEKWKLTHGGYESLEQFVDVHRIGSKSLEKTCIAILRTYSDTITSTEPAVADIESFVETKVLKSADIAGDVAYMDGANTPEQNKSAAPTRSSASRAARRRICSPMVTNPQKNAIRSFVSLHWTPCGLSWTRFALDKEKIDRLKTESAEITDWHHFNLDTHKMHLIDLAQLYVRISEKIPEADVYVMEEQPGGFFGQSSQLIQRIQSIALLTGMLANRANIETNESEEAEVNLYFIANNISGKLFGIFVGRETISNKFIVRKLMNPKRMVDDYMAVEVAESMANTDYTFGPAVTEYFSQSELFQKEQLGRSLLIGSAFLRLCILNCSKSMKLVERNSNHSIHTKG